MAHDARGSLWNRWDVHFHTPSSFDYHDKSVTNEQIVDRMVSEGIRVVAITDHHVIDVARIRSLQKLGGDNLTVLPAMELRDDHGGKPINYICVFSELADLDHVWTTIQGAVGLTAVDLKQKGGDEKVYVPIEKGAEITRKLGGVVSIHAGGKSNSIEGIENYQQFQQRIKYDITKDYVDLMEVGQIKDVDIHFSKIFPAIGLTRPVILCSDNHDIKNYSFKTPLWLRCDPTFRGLLMVLKEGQSRVFLGNRPSLLQRIEQSPTKFVRKLHFAKRVDAKTKEQWFSGTVEFNPGLVAIVGNKGAGKSALADTLGLVGGTKHAAAFSFLSKKRFRHPVAALAGQFEAEIEWESRERKERTLEDDVSPEDLELIKYLPQDYVENVCNEVGEGGEQEFERELKSVIVSHVPEEQRLGMQSLDELIWFQTSEKQKQIDNLVGQLRDASRARVYLEAQADPAVSSEIERKIKQRESELATHDAAAPKPVADPGANPEAQKAAMSPVLTELAEIESKRSQIRIDIDAVELEIKKQTRRAAVARRLIEKLRNFEKQFELLVTSLAVDANELGLKQEELVTLSINVGEPEGVANESDAMIASAASKLNAAKPPGLKQQLSQVESQLGEIKAKLDEPNRQFQAYLKERGEWQAKRDAIVGSEEDGESILGLKRSIQDMVKLPQRIAEQRALQLGLAMQILEQKRGQVAVYRALYGPVQTFIDSHPIAKDKLKLEFRAQLVEEDFASRLLEPIAQNRRGSFMGAEDGRARAASLSQAVNWEDPEKVKAFIASVEEALHVDLRDESKAVSQVKHQVAKGRKAEEIFDTLYALDYVRPRYVLRWDGKDLAMLSPGERGTLLLAFYLLIDKSDIPLVIDQPEGNLDNHTVAKVLVDCIREARNRRQVFIVTHNPNLAVVCDADQVVHASIAKSAGNAVTYRSGALENPDLSDVVIDVLEGTRWAFRVRDGKYAVGESV